MYRTWWQYCAFKFTYSLPGLRSRTRADPSYMACAFSLTHLMPHAVLRGADHSPRAAAFSAFLCLVFPHLQTNNIWQFPLFGTLTLVLLLSSLDGSSRLALGGIPSAFRIFIAQRRAAGRCARLHTTHLHYAQLHFDVSATPRLPAPLPNAMTLIPRLFNLSERRTHLFNMPYHTTPRCPCARTRAVGRLRRLLHACSLSTRLFRATPILLAISLPAFSQPRGNAGKTGGAVAAATALALRHGVLAAGAGYGMVA